MQDHFENIDASGSTPITRAEIDEMRRGDQSIRDDLRNQQEMNNNYIHDLIAQISRLTTSVQSLENRVSDLTNQNNDLQAQNNSLNQRLTDVFNSIEQRKLDEAKRANDLAEKQLAQQKAEAAAIAKREAEKVARNRQISEQLKKLEGERDQWCRYIDGRYSAPNNPNEINFGSKLEEWKRSKALAPGKITALDQRIASLRAQFK
jgi:chromosome segregation ATPase